MQQQIRFFKNQIWCPTKLYFSSLFLIYVNNLPKTLSFLKLHHFVDDTKFLYENFSLKGITRNINYDMSRDTQWLTENQFSLSIGEIVFVIFLSQQATITKNQTSEFRVSDQQQETKKSRQVLMSING